MICAFSCEHGGLKYGGFLILMGILFSRTICHL
jgi:hypothetical protein